MVKRQGVHTHTPPPIPFNRPTLLGGELENVRKAITNGQISAAGPF